MSNFKIEAIKILSYPFMSLFSNSNLENVGIDENQDVYFAKLCISLRLIFPKEKINKISVVWKMLQYSCTLQIPEYYAILRLCKQMGFYMSVYILFL